MEWSYSIRTIGAEPRHELARFLGFQTSRAKDAGDAWLWSSVVVDFSGGDLDFAAKDLGSVELVAECSVGKIVSSRLSAHRPPKGIRAIMEVGASKPGPVLIRAELRQRQRILTETALFILNAEG